MRRETLLFITGLLIFIIPFIGVPFLWKERALFVFGAIVVLLAIIYRMETRKRERESEDVLHEEHNPNTAYIESPVEDL